MGLARARVRACVRACACARACACVRFFGGRLGGRRGADSRRRTMKRYGHEKQSKQFCSSCGRTGGGAEIRVESAGRGFDGRKEVLLGYGGRARRRRPTLLTAHARTCARTHAHDGAGTGHDWLMTSTSSLLYCIILYYIKYMTHWTAQVLDTTRTLLTTIASRPPPATDADRADREEVVSHLEQVPRPGRYPSHGRVRIESRPSRSRQYASRSRHPSRWMRDSERGTASWSASSVRASIRVGIRVSDPARTPASRWRPVAGGTSRYPVPSPS